MSSYWKRLNIFITLIFIKSNTSMENICTEQNVSNLKKKMKMMLLIIGTEYRQKQ